MFGKICDASFAIGLQTVCNQCSALSSAVCWLSRVPPRVRFDGAQSINVLLPGQYRVQTPRKQCIDKMHSQMECVIGVLVAPSLQNSQNSSNSLNMTMEPRSYNTPTLILLCGMMMESPGCALCHLRVSCCDTPASEPSWNA